MPDNSTAPMAPKTNQGETSLWPSLELASRISDFANIFFIVSLVVGVVSTIVIVWMAGVKEDWWDQDRRISAERIAELTADADSSKADIAEANARAAEAQLALEKYKAPRTLTTEQQRAIEEALKPFAGQQYALSVAPGNEPAAFLCVLDGILTRAGWKQSAVIGSVTVGTDCGTAALNSLTGIDARRSPNASPAAIAAINALIEALANTDADARGRTDPVNNPRGDVIVLMVGAKA
jgi:hypothetical protein